MCAVVATDVKWHLRKLVLKTQPITSSSRNKAVIDLSTSEGSIVLPTRSIRRAFNSAEFISTLPSREDYKQITSLIADKYDVQTENVIIGNGSDEIIESIARLYATDRVLVVTPTFGRLLQANNKVGISSQNVHTFCLSKEKNFIYDHETHEKLKKQIREHHPSILWMCSPNNPTGTLIHPTYIAELSKLMPRGKIVVDQVFLDFLSYSKEYSCAALANKRRNIIVINSFSKTKGLAGLRLGFGFATKDITKELSSTNLYYGVSSPAVVVGLDILRNLDTFLLHQIQEMHNMRTELIAAVAKMPGIEYVSNSEINLICLRFRNPGSLSSALLKLGVKTKDLNDIIGISGIGYLRMKVPVSRKQLSFVLAALSQVLEMNNLDD